MAPPRTPQDAAMETAVRLLRGRARSAADVTRALERRGHPEEVVAVVLARLRTLGYLDDAAFARARASTLLRARHAPGAVAQRLAAHGLDQDAARRAVVAAVEDTGFDQASAARELLARRGLETPRTPKDRARAARALAARGFDEQVIAELLGEAWATVDPPGEGD